MRALFVQWVAALLVLCLAYPYFAFESLSAIPWGMLAWAIGATAAALSIAFRQAPWWWAIHLFFCPLLYFLLQLKIPPEWFLAAFIVFFLIFRGAVTTQVPLFLTNAETLLEIEKIFLEESTKKESLNFFDAGAGVASVVLFLAKKYPNHRFYAVENSPIPFLIGYFRTRRIPNVEWRWGNFEKQDFQKMDILYAFLSPAPMPKIWNQANRQMPKGALFLSNTFEVPGISAQKIVENEKSRTLFCYRL